MTIGKLLTESRKGGDLLAWYASDLYNFKSGTLKNTSGAQLDDFDPLGQPVKQISGQWAFVLATDEANAEGIVVDPTLIDGLANNGITSHKYRILVRGPATLVTEELPAEDAAGTAVDMDAVIAAIGSIAELAAPAASETQTT